MSKCNLAKGALKWLNFSVGEALFPIPYSLSHIVGFHREALGTSLAERSGSHARAAVGSLGWTKLDHQKEAKAVPIYILCSRHTVV